MTNLEYLQSLEPAQLKAWFESEHNSELAEAVEIIGSLTSACEKYRIAIDHLANAVAIYRDMFEDDTR